MIKLVYPFCFLNEYINLERRNKYAEAKVKRDTTFALTLMLKGQPKIDTPCGLHYTWTVPNKRRDPDNISWATKFVNDSLVKAGIIPNDNLKNIVELRHTFKIGDTVGVEINVLN